MIRQLSSVPLFLNKAYAQKGSANIRKIVSELGKFGRLTFLIILAQSNPHPSHHLPPHQHTHLPDTYCGI